MILKKKIIGSCTLLAAAFAVTTESYANDCKRHSTSSVINKVRPGLILEGSLGGIPEIKTIFSDSNIIYANLNKRDEKYYALQGNFTTKKSMAVEGSIGVGISLNDVLQFSMYGFYDKAPNISNVKQTEFTSPTPSFAKFEVSESITNPSGTCGSEDCIGATKTTYSEQTLFDQSMMGIALEAKVNLLRNNQSKVIPNVFFGGGAARLTLDFDGNELGGNIRACKDAKCNTAYVAATLPNKGYESGSLVKASDLLEYEKKYIDKITAVVRAGVGIDYKTSSKSSVGIAYRFSGTLFDPDLEGKYDNSLSLNSEFKRHYVSISMNLGF